MYKRTYWVQLIEDSLKERSVLWLMGVRRTGKTTLSQSLPGFEYFDCELPSHRKRMEDPEDFLSSLGKKNIVLDEIHRLPNPSQILKIAADHFPKVKIVATGSSTLTASTKFKDTLTGRKRNILLTPMTAADMADFGTNDLGRRFLRGGLPPFHLPPEFPEKAFQEWVDDYWAKDILNLYRLDLKASFERFMELLWAQSGGIFEASHFARLCEVNRKTIANYLNILADTHVVRVIRPFSSHKATEIVSSPKVYGFDTGFVCYYRGWRDLRSDDMGLLWEHFVLNEISARLQSDHMRYWRDKRHREIDFVWAPPGNIPTAIECKWFAANAETANLEAFKGLYPKSRLVVAARDVAKPYRQNSHGIEIEYMGLENLVRSLEGKLA